MDIEFEKLIGQNRLSEWKLTEGGEADPEGLPSPPAHPNCRCWMQTRTKIEG